MNYFILSYKRISFQGNNIEKIIELLDKCGGIINIDEFISSDDVQPDEIREEISKNIKGEEDSITLIGNDDALPYFRISNPAEDRDKYILSDNPYGCYGDEYLLPEIPTSRIPSDPDDPDFLLEFIKRRIKNIEIKNKTLGFSAKAWKEASMSVFNVAKGMKELYFSPPTNRINIISSALNENNCFRYFNIHGSDKRAEWFGQDGNSYPVLLKAEDIVKMDQSVIVSEACYGALLDKRNDGPSLAITFLKKGAAAFVGSTSISYGPSYPPNREADLIAKYFLQYVQEGIDFSRSLLLAKEDLMRKMIRLQGYLDEDDKKTLYQFVLYGFPDDRIIGERDD